MTVTVGRIEYIVGADGRILEREMRAAARKGGKKGGETLNDEMIGAFKRKWGGPSGFAKTLSKEDQKVIAHFNRLGLFTSKAYADKFAKSIRPKYEATAKKLVDHFNTITRNGTVIDLSRIFKGGPEAEAQIRHTRDLMVELNQAFALRLADKPEGFDVGPLKKFITVLDDAVKDENWDLLSKRQVEINHAVVEGAGALDKLIEAQDKRTAGLNKAVPVQSEIARSTGEYVEELEKLFALDRGREDPGFITGGKAIAEQARENLEIRKQLEAQQVKDTRLQREAFNLGKKQLELSEAQYKDDNINYALARETTLSLHRENQELEHAVRLTQQLSGAKVHLSQAEQDIVSALEKEVRFTADSLDQLVTTNYLYQQKVDLSEDLAVVQAEQAVAAYKLNKADKAALKTKITELANTEAYIDKSRKALGARQERLTLARAAAVVETEELQRQREDLALTVDRLTAGRDLMDLRNDELEQLGRLVDVEDKITAGRQAIAKADRQLDSTGRSLDRNTIRLEENVRMQRIMAESLAEVKEELRNSSSEFRIADKIAKDAAKAARAHAKAEDDLRIGRVRAREATEKASAALLKELLANYRAKDAAEAARKGTERERLSLIGLRIAAGETADAIDHLVKSHGKDVGISTEAVEREAESLIGLRIAAGEAAEADEDLVKSKKKVKKITEELVPLEKGRLQTLLDEAKAAGAAGGGNEALARGRKKAKEAAAESDDVVKGSKAEKSALNELTVALNEDTQGLKDNLAATVKLTPAQQRAAEKAAAAAKQTRKYAQAKADVDRQIGDVHAWNRLVAATGSVVDANDAVEKSFARMAKFGPNNVVATLAPLQRKLLNYVTASNAAQAATAAATQTAQQATTATAAHTAATNNNVTATNNNTQAHRDLLAQLNAQITTLMGNRTAWNRTVQNQGSVYLAMARTQQAIQALSAAAGPRYANTIARLNNQLQAHVQASNNAAAATNTLGNTVANTARASNTASGNWYRVGRAVRSVSSTFQGGVPHVNAFGRAIDDLGGKFSKLGTRSDLNPRAIAAIIAVLGEPIAVLGGALGPAILAVGSAVAAAVAGVATMAVAFSVLGKNVEDLPPELHDVVEEFGGLKQVLGQTQLNIANAAFSQMDGTFESLSATVDALTPALQVLGQSVGRVTAAFARNTAEGTTGFGEIERFLIAAGPMFESLADTAGTFMLSLLTGFRKAQPMTDAFLQWLQDLANDFDAFVQGNGFDEWLGHSMTIFESLGGLLDALGTMLNNLVTDESVARTAAFIDNLAAFAPHLENIIAFFGELDVLGLVSSLLVEVGDALLPLVPLFDELAALLRDDLAGIISGFAGGIDFLAHAFMLVLAPLNAFLEALSPQYLGAIATALTIVGGALLAITAVRGLRALNAQLLQIGAGMTYVGRQGSALGRASTALGGMVRHLPLIAAAVPLVGLLANTLADLADSAADAAPGINEITNGLKSGNLQTAFSNASASADSFGESLELIKGDSFKAKIEGFGEGLGAVFGVQGVMTEARSALTGLDAGMAQLVQGGNLDLAKQRFDELAIKAKEQGISVTELKDLMPQYVDALAGVSSELEVVKTPLQENADIMQKLKEETALTQEELDGLAESIRNFGNQQLDTRESARQYNQAIIDLTEDLKENGVQTDITTQLGIDQQGELDTLIQKTNGWAAEVYASTGNQEEANRVLGLGRQALIDMYKQFDPAGFEAGEYNDELALIPTDIQTLVKVEGEQAAKTAAANITASLNGIKDKYVKVNITPTVTAMRDGNGNLVVSSGLNSAIFGKVNFGAAGGVYNRPTNMILGEAGSEALVPLRRPLSMVDPSVRALSAFAQGLTPAAPLRGNTGTLTAGRTLTISPGAITIQGTLQPEAVATNVVNRIAERLN